MVDNVSFKVVLKDKETEDELRRFVVDKEVSTSFPYLQEKLCLVFPQLKQKIFSVTWTDDDGDMVTIATDEELIIALTEMPGPVYKLKVDVKSPKKTDDAMNDSNQDSQIHHGVTCDVCEKTPIEGNRYKCVVCDDFDLCGSCEAAGRHPGHNMMRISNPEMVFPQRLFKRIHKMQERAEKHRSFQKKENGDSTSATPPPFGCPRRGRGMHGFGGMPGMGHMRGGFGGMGGMRGGMGGMRGGCGAGAWAGPAFEAMMKGWMGEPQMGNKENKSESNTSKENQKAHAAQEAQNETTNGATGASSSSDQEAMKAAFEQFATMTGSAEYLKNVGNFVAAALDPFGIDVQVNVETPEGAANSATPQASNSSSASSSSSTSDAEEGNKPEQKDAEKADAEKSKSPALDEEWTVVTDKEEEANAVNITIKPTENPGTDNLYPSLPKNSTASTASPAAVAAAPQTAPAAAEPEPVASHPDPKIQVALQAMMNMGFSNEGGWMTSLLEAKSGDIGKVLDILQPVRK